MRTMTRTMTIVAVLFVSSLPANAQSTDWGKNASSYQTAATQMAPHSLKRQRHIRGRKNETRPSYGLPTDSVGNTFLIQRARADIGRTASQIGLKRHSQWCAAYLRHLGVPLPDDRAISGLKLSRTSARIGAIAVYPHHIGIVTGFDGGYPIIISGNSNGRRVYEGVYPRRPIAYVDPS